MVYIAGRLGAMVVTVVDDGTKDAGAVALVSEQSLKRI